MASLNLLLFLILFTFQFYSACSLKAQPISTSKPVYPFTTHPLKPSGFADSAPPLPTNSFFTNIFLGSGESPIMQLPYELKTESEGLSVCYPSRTATQAYIITTWLQNLSLYSSETLSSPTTFTKQITSWDELSVTVQWKSSSGAYLRSNIVRGSAFATLYYSSLTPYITTQHAILSVNSLTTPGTVTDKKFKITLNNGQTWLVYASSSITLNWATTTYIKATSTFSGYLRATLLLGNSESTFDAHYDAVPSSAQVSYNVTGDTGTITFDFKYTSSLGHSLLMFALPHHVDTLKSPSSFLLTNTYRTMKGYMSAVVGSQWIIKLNLPTISWYAPNPIDSDKVSAISSALSKDASFVPSAGDPYTYGKEIAKLGRLALIADQLGDKTTASQIRNVMKNSLSPWLNSTNDDNLLYDSTWGGVVSSDGVANPNADYGQGYYNDHHFHYGYFFYAFAAILKEDESDWGTGTNFQAMIDLLRDVGNPSDQDPYFPVARNKDWFTGHSWASGLFEFADSKDQESSSEAVNCYYGIYLFGLSIGNTEIEQFGRLLLATEIQSTQKYWHIKPDDPNRIYEDVFAKNTVVGILWSTKVDYATFFGANVEYIHCIQMLPFTPITESLLNADWVTEEYPVLKPATSTASQGWLGFIYMDHAVIDPTTAWTEVNTLTDYDNGNSKTNTLYWVATRP